MTIGTKSVLFGAHCFFLHPFYVAAAWWKLYGFPFDPRLWVAFFVHDLGYFGKPNMDGPEGERHVEFGAKVMSRLFNNSWHDFSLYHSRHYAKLNGAAPSKLCFADKLAFCYQIKPVYLFMTRLTGELTEYRTNEKYWRQQFGDSHSAWYDDLSRWVQSWVEKHIDGSPDLVTVNRTSDGKRV